MTGIRSFKWKWHNSVIPTTVNASVLLHPTNDRRNVWQEKMVICQALGILAYTAISYQPGWNLTIFQASYSLWRRAIIIPCWECPENRSPMSAYYNKSLTNCTFWKIFSSFLCSSTNTLSFFWWINSNILCAFYTSAQWQKLKDRPLGWIWDVISMI